MGFLVDVGQTFNYHDSKPLIDYIKKHGILQFLCLYQKFKDLQQETLFWGDEIEFHLLNMDSNSRSPRLQTNTEAIFAALSTEQDFYVQPEFGSWMIEAVPANPYEFNGDPFQVLRNMDLRRAKINSLCREGDVLFAGTAFPLLGVGDYFVPNSNRKYDPEIKKNPYSRSQFVHDEIITDHPRFPTNVENIRQRRGEKMCALMPIYQDEKTSKEPSLDEPVPGYIYMDALHFGMGSGCLQVTFGAKNIDEARYLTDQLAVLSSIMLPMTAATAIFKGKLADVDVRWNTIAASVDCRNKEEKDPNHPSHIPKSRYASISRYISTRPQCKEEYNDIYFPLNEELMDFAKEQAEEMELEIDETMIKHLGLLFMRDPMVIFPDKIFLDDNCFTNHFENIQSTNWNSVRFKPPPSFTSKVGWRVELRTPENQLTSEENVAYSMFSYFMVAMIKKKEYNLYIPISKVDENMERGHKRDAILKEKFWFRKDIQKDSADEWVELSLDEILHGKADTFVGLMNLIYDFCKEEYGIDMQEEWKKMMAEGEKYKPENKVAENMRFFDLLSKRVQGKIPTVAAWVRSFVLKHPKYEKDSIVSKEIAYDLINAMNSISNYEKRYQDFM